MHDALHDLLSTTTPGSFADGLSDFLEALRQKTPDHPVWSELVRAASRRDFDGPEQTCHELRSLLTAVAINADGGRSLLDQFLSQLPHVHIGLVADLRECLADTAKAADRAVIVSTQELRAASIAGTKSSAPLSEVIALAVRLVNRKQRRPKITITKAPPQMVHDCAGELLQVLLNLLGNALDAVEGQTDPRVAVSGWASATSMFVRVEDNGPGIATGDTYEVFKLFRTTKPDGHGIGLFVCQKLAEEWGGHIEVASTKGTGTKFTLSIPIPLPQNGPDPSKKE